MKTEEKIRRIIDKFIKEKNLNSNNVIENKVVKPIMKIIKGEKNGN